MLFVQLAHTMTTTTSAQGGGVDNEEEENYLQSELSSLGIVANERMSSTMRRN
jgi:hypothetical protein